MELKELAISLFEGKSVVCSDMDIDYSMLCEEDMLLPFLCLHLLMECEKNEETKDVLGCEFIKTESSLLFVRVSNVQIFAPHLARGLLSPLIGKLVNANLITITDNDDYDIQNLVHRFRLQLNDINEGSEIEFNALFKLVFKMRLQINKEEEQPVISESSKNCNDSSVTEENRKGRNEKIKSELKRDNDQSLQEELPSFNYTKQFYHQNEQIRDFFNDIVFVKVAKYLKNFPNKNITSIQSEHTTTVGVECIFNSILASPVMLKQLSKKLGLHPWQVIFPKSVLNIRTTLSEIVDPRTSNDGSSSSKTWFKHGENFTPFLTFSKEVMDCLQQSHIDGLFDIPKFFEAFLQLDNKLVAAFKKTNGKSYSALHLARKSKLLTEQLSNKVIGQNQAIESVSKGFLSSSLKPNQGPRLIYTFLGPSGVGKTYLASQFTELLQSLEGNDYQFSSYSMENYADERDGARLFGSGAQYTDSAMGLLTTSVKCYPRQVIVFDEIEKAHTNVIQSLLSILDTGIGKDVTSSDEIDFSQCIVIFTSNLGQEKFAQNKTGKELNVLDILATSKNPNSGVKLAPEFINRLTKGYPILFNALKVNHFINLAEREINSSKSVSGLTFNFNDRFSSFLIQTICPDLNVRRLLSAISKFQADVILEIVDLVDSDVDSLNIDIEIKDELHSLNEALNILILDDDHRIVDAEQRFTVGNSKVEFDDVSLNHCHQKEDLEKYLIKHKPDVLLVDLEIIENKSELQQVIDIANRFNQHIIIFTFIVDCDNTGKQKLGINNEVREHFSLEYSNANINQLKYLIDRIRYYFFTEMQVRKVIQRHQTLKYTPTYNFSGDNVLINLDKFEHKQLVFSDDLSKSNFFKFSLPETNLNDVIGLERAKQRLNEVVSWMKNPKQLASLQVDIPTGFLFSGPPGTGKTLLARSLAGECELPFFSVAAADLVNTQDGSTSQNIKELFETARKYAPAIIFIDEIDAIGLDRSKNDSMYNSIVVNTLLTEMDGFTKQDEPIFVLAATNYAEVLDKALTRPGRFDETIICDLPNKSARKQFLDLFVKKHQLIWQPEDISILVDRTQGLSSAELDQVLRESLYLALGAGTGVSMEHVNDCITRISYGLPSASVIMSEEEKRRTAYHESGHLIAYKLLFPDFSVDFVTIIPRDQALGFVAARRPDEYNGNTRDSISKHLQVLLAGRVAEKLCVGDSKLVSTGAASDIQKATQYAMDAIYEGGLSEDIGSVNLKMLTKYEESNLLHTAQENVRHWIAQSETDIETLLLSNYELFSYFAEELIQKESLHGDEIEKIINEFHKINTEKVG